MTTMKTNDTRPGAKRGELLQGVNRKSGNKKGKRFLDQLGHFWAAKHG